MKTGASGLRKLSANLRRYLADPKGTTSIEYALIAVGIAFVIIVAVFALGGNVGGLYNDINTGFDNASSS